jgi:hypothetical protein
MWGLDKLRSADIIMSHNKITPITVGADLSRPQPIYRPSVAFTISPYIVKNHYRPL